MNKFFILTKFKKKLVTLETNFKAFINIYSRSSIPHLKSEHILHKFASKTIDIFAFDVGF